MLPRKKLDIGWSDLFFGIGCCLLPISHAAARRRVEEAWASESIVCLSVRSGLDLLLRALALPRGSEILVSAVTIRDMIRIIEQHGLVPVPVDLQMATLSLSVESLERAVSPRTRAVLVAHLFGSRMPLDAVVDWAQERGLPVLEDCAQAYVGNGYRGHPESDVCMFSFGPIKTNTALGGGILRLRDPSLRERMRRLQDGYPVQSRLRFLHRLTKYVGIKLLLVPPVFSVFVAACRAVGRCHDEVISAAVRGFPGAALIASIRHQPGYPLLALLHRRLRRFDPVAIEQRMEAAHAALRLTPRMRRPGALAEPHTYWVFPIQSHSPDRLVHFLWQQGFDATRGASSLHVVEPPAERGEFIPTEAGQAMREVLYLPIYPGISRDDLQRLAQAVTDFEAAPA
jgi:perosamine synthetase